MSTAADFKATGNKHLQAKEFDLAIEAYTKAIELDGSDHVFFSNRSAAYLSKGDASNALEDANKVIELKSDWPKGFTRKGAALHGLKQYEEAISAYEEGLKIAPTDAGLKSGLEDCQKAMAQPAGNPMAGLFSEEMLGKLANHPKFGKKLADPMFRQKLQLMQTNPNMLMQDPEMMELLQALIGGGFPGGPGGGDDQPFAPSPSASASSTTTPPPPAKDPEPILSDEEKAVKSVKDKAIAAKDRGNKLYKEKKFDEALAAYDEAMLIDPENILIVSNKAAVYIEMKDEDRAISICEQALDTDKRVSFEVKAKLLARIAGAYQKKGDYDKCFDYYSKAQMENFDKTVERKVKTLELELRKKAIADYIDPEKAQEAKERGNALFREGKFGEATKEYEDAVKRDPNSAPLRNNLAAALVKIMDMNGAKIQVEKAIEIDPKYVKAWAKKGDVEFFMKEYHKSMDSYNAGLAIEPDNKLCKDGLVKVHMKINEANASAPDAERQAHAMADPEIQQILSDMTIRQLLQDMQENPQHAQMVMQKDANIRAKVEKLIAAGILQVK